MRLRCVTIASKSTKRRLVNTVFPTILVELVLWQQWMQFGPVDGWHNLSSLEELRQIDGQEIGNPNDPHKAGVEQLLHLCPSIGEVPILRILRSVLLPKIRSLCIVFRQ
jgi:hypothetical protein